MTPHLKRTLGACLLLMYGAAPYAASLTLTPAQRANLGIAVAPASSTAGVATEVVARVILPPTAVAVVAAGGAGLVTRISVQAGDSVKRGARLVTLSMPGLAEAQADVTRTRVRAELADATAKRDEKLLGEGLIASARVRASHADAASARADLNAAQARLRLLGNGAVRGAELTLSSPLAGSVLAVSAEPGARVDAGTPLVKLADLSKIALEIPLTADQAANVQVGQALTLPDGTGGRIAALLPQLDAAQNVLARATLKSAPVGLRPGQTVRVALTAGHADNGLVVPAVALVWKDRKAHVFVETKTGFEAVPVRVLRQNASQAEVIGLATGARVAVKGVAALKANWLGE